MDADKEETLDAIAITLVRPTSVLPDDVQMRLYKADGGVADAGSKGASVKAKGADEILIDSSELFSHSE